MQALYGRNGECPMTVLADMTPADCFWDMPATSRIPLPNMVTAEMATDCYTGYCAEPWNIPDVTKIKPFPVQFRTDPEGYFVYARDPDTLARQWVKPGTAGLEHRIGGLEKHRLTGAISYDPQNHEEMVRTRAAKV